MNRPFDHTLREIRFGECLDELTKEIGTLVAAVNNTGKAGSITLTIKLKPVGGGAIEVSDDIKAKIPLLPKGSSVFFATPENNLVRNDPRQPQLEGLKDVSTATAAAPLKEVAA